MPFGSIFGSIVFGILGPVFGLRMLADHAIPVRVMGACLMLLGLTVAVGLLMKRSWARWIGILAASIMAALAFAANASIFHLTVLLASLAVAVLLLVPATGRPRIAIPAAPAPPSVVSRVLCGAACVAIVGFVAAAPSTLVRAPVKTPAGAEAAKPAEPGAEKAVTAEPVKWHDFAEGLAQARSGRKLMVADFYATWCGPCKIMEKRTFKDPRVLERLHDVVPVRVDAEETVERGGLKGIDLALRYAVEAYPTIVVVDGEGHEIARNTGAMSADDFLAWLDAVIERAGTTVARS